MFNLFFNFILKIIHTDIYICRSNPFGRAGLRVVTKNTLSRHMHWRDKMWHVGTLRSARKGSVSSYSTCQPYHATPTGVTVQPCHATPAGVTKSDFRKIIFFHTNSDGDNFYMKIVSLNEIYNFVVLNFFHLKSLRRLNN